MYNFDAYALIQINTLQKKQFFFESIGRNTIIKAVEYTLVMEIDARPIHNLAFGDYDPMTNSILDHVNSNNGDMYKVFNTVLSTIPLFFQTNPNDMVFVRGSDISRTEAYCYFVKKHFEFLSQEYVIYGGIIGEESTTFTPFKSGKDYDCLLVQRENSTNFNK